MLLCLDYSSFPFLCSALLCSALQLNVNSVELLNDAGSEYTAGTKLHFKIRLKAKDYKGTYCRELGSF